MMDLAVRWCVLIAVTLNSLTIGPLAVRAGPVSVNFAVSPFGRNIRPISCTSKSGDEGVCMFAMDCTRTNGHHLGTCVDRFYFGSCCGPARDGNSTGPTSTTTELTSSGPSTGSTFNGNNDLGQTTIPSSTSAVWLPPSTQQEQQPSNTLGELPTDSTTWTTTVPVTSSTSSTTEEASSTPLSVTQSVTTSEPTTGTASTTLEATTTPSTTTVEATTSSSTTTVEATTSPSTPGSTSPSPTTTEGIKIDEISPTPSQSPSPDTTTVKTPSTTLPTQLTELTNTEAESPETTEIPSISEESSPEPESTETSFITEETTNWVDVIYTSPEPEIEFNTESSTNFETDTPDTTESSQPSSSTTTLVPPETVSTTTLVPTETVSPIKAPGSSVDPIVPETTTPEPTTASPETTSKPIITTVVSDTTLSPTTSSSSTTTTDSSTTVTTTTVESTTVSSTSSSIETTASSNSTESSWPFPISSVAPTDSTLETSTLVSEISNSTASPTPPSVSWNETSTSVNGTTVQFQDYREVCGRPEYHYPSARIVGGTTTHYGQWPWQVSLRQWRTATFLHKCGAALLNENWAITAAHCVDNVQPDDLLLRMGEYDLATDEEQYPYVERKVQIVASHPQFDSRTFEYDLALLRFYDPVRFQPNIIPICLPEVNPEVDFVGRTAYVTGWGRLYEDGPLPSKMQQVQVPIINNTECENMYRRAGYVEHIPNIFICAGYADGKRDSCEGDSGGPLVIQDHNIWRLAGVISWGIGCAEANQPGVYTRITEFREWIDKIIVF